MWSRGAFDRGALAVAAQLLGVTEQLIEIAADYACEREQFGRPIGSFQAIKHHLANVLLALEFARPVTYRAAYSVAHDHPDRSIHVSMAKSFASDAATLAARTALQVHGAIGYTWEHDLHLWMKRAWALAAAWGDASVASRAGRASCPLAREALEWRGSSYRPATAPRWCAPSPCALSLGRQWARTTRRCGTAGSIGVCTSSCGCGSRRSTCARCASPGEHLRRSKRVSPTSSSSTWTVTGRSPGTPPPSGWRSSTPSGSPPTRRASTTRLMERLREHFDAGEVVELTLVIAKYIAFGRFMQVLGLDQSCEVTFDERSARK